MLCTYTYLDCFLFVHKLVLRQNLTKSRSWFRLCISQIPLWSSLPYHGLTFWFSIRSRAQPDCCIVCDPNLPHSLCVGSSHFISYNSAVVQLCQLRCRAIAGMPGGIGGMHVGPHDPIFAGRRGGPGLPSGPFPGVRYDPTNPQGLEVSSLCCPRPPDAIAFPSWR